MYDFFPSCDGHFSLIRGSGPLNKHTSTNTVLIFCILKTKNKKWYICHANFLCKKKYLMKIEFSGLLAVFFTGEKNRDH